MATYCREAENSLPICWFSAWFICSLMIIRPPDLRLQLCRAIREVQRQLPQQRVRCAGLHLTGHRIAGSGRLVHGGLELLEGLAVHDSQLLVAAPLIGRPL